jgi:hypothetical protein
VLLSLRGNLGLLAALREQFQEPIDGLIDR